MEPFSYSSEFMPLTATQAPNVAETPAEPVSWFRRMAPSPDETNARPASRSSDRALFATVEEIQRLHREQEMIGAPEPAEILKLREEAHNAAQELVGNAYARAQTIEDEARERGHREGYAQGFLEGVEAAKQQEAARAEQERVALRHDIELLLTHIEAERLRAWERLEPQAMDLVFALATHILKQEVEVNRSVALATVRNALRRVGTGDTLRVRVHADDLETLRGHRGELLSLVDGVQHLEIIEDRRVDVGGCVIETSAGTIDARIETQLSEMRATLEEIKARPKAA